MVAYSACGIGARHGHPAAAVVVSLTLALAAGSCAAPGAMDSQAQGPSPRDELAAPAQTTLAPPSTPATTEPNDRASARGSARDGERSSPGATQERQNAAARSPAAAEQADANSSAGGKQAKRWHTVLHIDDTSGDLGLTGARAMPTW